MSKTKNVLLPEQQRLLASLGEKIRLARLRRKLSTALLSERAGISRNTLRAIENGKQNVSFGAYVSVLFCLGLADDLKNVASDDELGRKLQDLDLPIKIRAPKVKRTEK